MWPLSTTSLGLSFPVCEMGMRELPPGRLSEGPVRTREGGAVMCRMGAECGPTRGAGCRARHEWSHGRNWSSAGHAHPVGASAVRSVGVAAGPGVMCPTRGAGAWLAPSRTSSSVPHVTGVTASPERQNQQPLCSCRD